LHRKVEIACKISVKSHHFTKAVRQSNGIYIV
jgi:hypothetical protein